LDRFLNLSSKNKSIMKTRLLMMVGMMVSTTMFAQQTTRDSRKSGDRGFEGMKRELALSEEQYASVKRIDSKYDTKRDEQRVKIDRRRFEEKEEMRAFRLDREREMRKVFTPAQNLKWDKIKSERKMKHGKRGAAHRKHGKRFYKNDKRVGREMHRHRER
jgi:hypothetical protein